MEKKIITIVGMGPLISFSVAARFAEEGYAVAMIARNEDKLKEFKERLTDKGFEANYFVGDASSDVSLRKAIARVHEEMGTTSVLFYNVANIRRGNLLEEKFSQLVEDFKGNVAGAMTAVKAVYPFMRDANQGSILITGGGLSIDPHPDYASLSIGKAGIRNFTHSLARSVVNSNIYVGTLIIRDFVKAGKDKYNPVDIADQFYNMHTDKKLIELEY